MDGWVGEWVEVWVAGCVNVWMPAGRSWRILSGQPQSTNSVT